MSETESLLPCPFCGGSADFVHVTRGFGVFAGCNLCQASVFAIDENNPSDIASHRKLVADAWNRRGDTVPRAAVAPALRELRAKIEAESDTFDSGLESWPYDHCRQMVETTIAALGLTIHEDQLPKTLTDSQYSEWFAASWIQDGVRVGFPITEEKR